MEVLFALFLPGLDIFLPLFHIFLIGVLKSVVDDRDGLDWIQR
jgi:hypothetical protein